MEAAGQIVGGISLPLVHGTELTTAITIPLFTGAIGYVINWTRVWMLFYPVRFAGFRLPGLPPIVTLLPRKVQQIPGFMHGAVGLAGDHPLAGREDGVDCGRQGDRQAWQPVGVLPPARPGAHRRAHHCHVQAGCPRRRRADHAPRASGPVGRPAAARPRGGARQGPGAAPGDRPRGHRGDRRQHRPAPGP